MLDIMQWRKQVIFEGSRRGMKMRRHAIAALLIFIVGLLFACAPRPVENYPDLVGPGKPPVLRVSFIDVGQGDSILIEAPAMTVLVDGGERSEGPIVVDYIRQQGIDALDLVIATHPHADHIGGLLDVLEAFTVGRVIDSGRIHTSQTYLNYLQRIDDKDIPFEVADGQKFDLGQQGVLEVLGPVKEYDDPNNSSVVTMLQFGAISILLTGDMEPAAETDLVAEREVAATVLKVGHHGSRTSTSPEFLDKVNPQIGVVLVGEGNRYGHPSQEVLQLLEERQVTVYRTDRDGTVVIETDGTKIEVITEKQP
jgi:beta-lactamase superfamily II metal-dependent hydrolase